MNCDNCIQQIKDQIEQRQAIQNLAQETANESGQDVAICEGGYIRKQSELSATDYPREYISPKR